MRHISKIIIHCSATVEGQDFNIDNIDRWHKARGWSSVGYHYVIRLDGTLEKGRKLKDIGAHAKYHNRESIGICYIGGLDEQKQPKDTRTPEQDITLVNLLTYLRGRFPDAKIIGHNEVSAKACPSFDVQEAYGWLND
jgi:N-acetylmuramoyl-L-alanine amidase